MIITTRTQELRLLENVILSKFHGGTVNIVEAGCGRKWPFKLPQSSSVHITGIDRDYSALSIRLKKSSDLHDFQCCDLLEAHIPSGHADVIYCSFVFEHLDSPPEVLQKFADWLASDGVIVLRFPNPESVFGCTTKHTPHFLHVLYHKYVKRYKEAGAAGHPPFPTVYHSSLKQAEFRLLLEDCGLEVAHRYDVNTLGNLSNPWRFLYTIYSTLVNIISLGAIDSKVSGFAYVLKKI